MPKFIPSDEDLRQSVNALERSEKKFKPWRTETEFYNGLYVNDFQTYNEASPGGEASIGRGVTTTVVRNGIYFSVNAAIRRKQIKNPKFEAEPQISSIMRDTPDGQSVEVESSYAAYAQGETATLMTRVMRLSDQMIPVLEENEIGNEAWLKIVSWDGADAPEMMAWVDDNADPGGKDSESSVKKIKPRKPVNSLANARFPGAIFVSNSDIICDADAIMQHEFTRITHRIVKPLSQMRSQEVNDYEFVQDPKTGSYKYVTKIDPETGEPVRKKKYMNLEGLQGNYEYYIEKRMAGMRKDKKGDIRNVVMGLTEHDPKDYLVFFEESFCVPADSAIVEKEFGFVPKTIDGFCYGWKTYVEQTDKNGGGSGEGAPTLIRFDWYPVDMGGFCLKRLQGRPKAGSQKGFSWIRNAYEAQALENYWDSYDTDWYSAIKPTNVWDRNKVDPALIKAVTETGEHLANVLADIPAGGSLRDVMFTTQFSDSPQGIAVMKMRARGIQDEASGASANQRLQSSGDVSATQSSLISQSADDQTSFDIEIIKQFIEDVVLAQMRVFIASLPESGRFEIPGSEGGFTIMDRMQLDLTCVYKLTYTSFNQAPNPVENKQLGELTNKIVNTPEQLWAKMMPFWECEASRFTPAVMAAFRKFQKGLGNKPDTDPMKEHVLMGVGIPVEPDQNENFIETIPQHQKFLQEVTANPIFAQWNEPVRSRDPKQNGNVPRTLLAVHYKKSCNIAIAKGMGPALGLKPDAKGQASQEDGRGGNQPGSAQDSGRMTQEPPENGAVESGANSIEMPSA